MRQIVSESFFETVSACQVITVMISLAQLIVGTATLVLVAVLTYTQVRRGSK
jgi:hypothetical protein